MRTAFIDQLIEEASKNDRIFLLVGDLGFSVVEDYAQRFPNQYLNVGIAEQNMAGMAAGLAMQGYCVYIYSIGNFPTLRCMEQIRYDICYHNLNVKIVAVGGGYAYGPLGPSHHATEELGMLRTIPNLVVTAPGDPVEAKAITAFSATYNGPMYIRLGKAGEPLVHATYAINDIKLGDILTIAEGSEIAVFSTGAMLKYVKDFIDKYQISSAVYSFPFVKPINKDRLAALLAKYKKVITIEEHQMCAGFGSAILEYSNDFLNNNILNSAPCIKRIGIPDKFFSMAGSQQYLREAAGIVLQVNDFEYN